MPIGTAVIPWITYLGLEPPSPRPLPAPVGSLLLVAAYWELHTATE